MYIFLNSVYHLIAVLRWRSPISSVLGEVFSNLEDVDALAVWVEKARTAAVRSRAKHQPKAVGLT
ncbi:MAG: hypothetical protein KME35_09825 [Aphanocapsa sp. GSE-SYN-MK-11-07L]|nr:hypothetical protein [Aphanocapsa sp. GSE-SYN-MK-11-07L]